MGRSRARLVFVPISCRAGRLRCFLIFSIMKNDIFCIFSQFDWGLAFFIRAGTEIGYRVVGFKEIGTFNKKNKISHKCRAMPIWATIQGRKLL